MARRSPSLVVFHVVWATLRRLPLLPVAFDSTLGLLLGRKAKREGCILFGAGIASDHVHVLLRVAPTVPLARVVQRLKGATAFEINVHRLLHPRIVWQAGYWAESVTPADLPPLRDYLHRQRAHHDDSHPAECWQAADAANEQ